MQAIHQTLLPGTAIYHSLFLEHFTPSTIYPYPQPSYLQQYAAGSSSHSSSSDYMQIKVVGNLIAAGGSQLRVFEVRQEPVWAQSGEGSQAGIEQSAERVKDEQDRMCIDGVDVEQEGYNSLADTNLTSQPKAIANAQLRLYLVSESTLHGTITGLAGIRTMSSLEDGLDRLLISFKDAKLAMLEWSRGEISTVSLHTYERCAQVMYGDVDSHRAILRSDPNHKLAALTLPSNGLAMLPFVQDLVDTETAEASYGRDVPYTPSFVLPLDDISSSIHNLKDFAFLPGFNNPTIAFLFEPNQTSTGRLAELKDSFCVEIRSIDVISKTYAQLGTASGLPLDCLYMVPAPTALGGVVVVSSTAIIHVDQNGKKVASSVNGWLSRISSMSADTTYQSRMLELDASKAEWIDEKNLFLVMRTGAALQIRFEIEGRLVSKIIPLEHRAGQLGSPASLAKIGGHGFFVGAASGDSQLGQLSAEEDTTIIQADTAMKIDIDIDEDLYGDSAKDEVNGDASKQEKRYLHTLNVTHSLAGIGYMTDICMGASSRGGKVNMEPELVYLHGTERQSTIELARPGLPLRRQGTIAEFRNATNMWTIRKPSALASTPKDATFQSSGIVLATTAENSFLYSYESHDVDPDVIEEYDEATLAAGPVAGGSRFVRVSAGAITICDLDGHALQSFASSQQSQASATEAAVKEPYVALRRSDNSVSIYAVDGRSGSIQPLFEAPEAQPIANIKTFFIVNDTTGMFRTFETERLNAVNGDLPATRHISSSGNAGDKMQLTEAQLKRLQEENPTISSTSRNNATELDDTANGSFWLTTVDVKGRLEVRSLPDLAIVFASTGLVDAATSLLDDAEDSPAHNGPLEMDVDDDAVPVNQAVFATVGSSMRKPHLLVLHGLGDLLVYEATPRFTLESLVGGSGRRSLAIRWRKVLTKTLSRSRTPRRLLTDIRVGSSDIACVTGSPPFWIHGDGDEGLRITAHPESFNYAYLLPCVRGEVEIACSSESAFSVWGGPSSSLASISSGTERPQLSDKYTHIIFDAKSRHYVGASVLEQRHQLYTDECETVEDPIVPNCTEPVVERSSLELLDPVTWEAFDGYDFEENEAVLCMRNLTLEAASHPSGFKQYIGVGTSVYRGENIAPRGITYIFEVAEVVTESSANTFDGSKTRWGLTLVCQEEAKGPVSAMANLGPHIINSEGQKIYVKAFDKEERLVPVAFLDVNDYTTSITTMRNLVLIGDMVKSVWFCVFQEEPFKLDVVARDYQDAEIDTVNFLTAEGQVTFVSTDQAGNARMMVWDPEHSAGIEGGDALTRITEYNLGAAATKAISAARRKPTEDKSAVQSQIVFGDEYGGLSTLIPSKAARFKRLQLLQGLLARSIQHVAGLNPKAYRNVHNPLATRAPNKNILDGQLLSSFINLPISRQRELVQPIGTTRETVLNDLSDLSGFGDFF